MEQTGSPRGDRPPLGVSPRRRHPDLVAEPGRQTLATQPTDDLQGRPATERRQPTMLAPQMVPGAKADLVGRMLTPPTAAIFEMMAVQVRARRAARRRAAVPVP